jgi:hypothetical protein
VNNSTLQRLLREPLLHFIAIGALLFLLYGTLNDAAQDESDNVIIITPERIAQINKGFNSVWSRNPSDEELDNLIELEIRSEVYYRDALALGLDKNDAGVRRRLQQKLEFLSDTGSYLKDPSSSELDAFYTNNQQDYQQPPRLAFEQLYLGENPAKENIDKTLEQLLTEPAIDPYTLGQRSGLPPQLRLSTPRTINSVFGPEFYQQIGELAPGEWSGPVTSTYGLHLVRTLDGTPARTPPLEDIRATVLKDWKQENAREARELDYKRRRARFEVEIQRNG